MLVAAVVFLGKHRNRAYLGRTGYMYISAATVAAVVFQINTGKGYSWVGLGIDIYSNTALLVFL